MQLSTFVEFHHQHHLLVLLLLRSHHQNLLTAIYVMYYSQTVSLDLSLRMENGWYLILNSTTFHVISKMIFSFLDFFLLLRANFFSAFFLLREKSTPSSLMWFIFPHQKKTDMNKNVEKWFISHNLYFMHHPFFSHASRNQRKIKWCHSIVCKNILCDPFCHANIMMKSLWENWISTISAYKSIQ